MITFCLIPETDVDGLGVILPQGGATVRPESTFDAFGIVGADPGQNPGCSVTPLCLDRMPLRGLGILESAA
jgi:hypothetical protein